MNTREIEYISIDAESIERDVKKRMSISWLGSNCGSGVLTFLIEVGGNALLMHQHAV